MVISSREMDVLIRDSREQSSTDIDLRVIDGEVVFEAIGFRRDQKNTEMEVHSQHWGTLNIWRLRGGG